MTRKSPKATWQIIGLIGHTTVMILRMEVQEVCAAGAEEQMEALGAGNATRMTDIHDIKPALEMGMDPIWLYWAAAAVMFVVIGSLVWKYWVRKRKSPTTEPEIAPIAPEVEAYQALDALAAEPGGEAKQFYFRLSAILRHYIERRYAIPAAEMTTEELLPAVDQLALGPDLVRPLHRFCLETDPIKFAGAWSNSERLPRDLAFARDFVRQTTAQLESAQGDEGALPGETAQLMRTT